VTARDVRAWLLAVLAVVAGCTMNSDPVPPPDAPSAAVLPAPAAVPSGGRQLTPTQRARMLEILRAEPDAARRIYIHVAAPDPVEPSAFARELAGVFHEAGWPVTIGPAHGVRTTEAGVHFLAPEEEIPGYAATALRALLTCGVPVVTITDFRSDPRFVGVVFAPDETFDLVVGPPPAAEVVR